ncbi:hypothetical protein [Nostoc sp. FACHB-133]|uniref:hypothetical protein n=1 Tax=Nostoc sp. FACHB-133 TaxID=2692835 RepID=UPI001687BDA3|nr:hypothetical protein [Nostoc sp. FACHB-133]MBD2520889.1 hypothetical protein [Nostoc sp. FACHB-133]
MYKLIDILKVDRGERFLSSYWLIPHRSLGISFSKERQQTRFLDVKTGLLTNFINNFSKTLNKYLIASHVFGCSIDYIEIVSKLILGNSPSRFASMYKIEFI